MKYIKLYKIFNEAVINTGLSSIKFKEDIKDITNLEILREFLNLNYNTILFTYDEFFKTLSDNEKKGAPPRHAQMGTGIRFGFWTKDNRCAIVYDENNLPRILLNNRLKEDFINDLFKIINHEQVHNIQSSKFNRTELPDTSNLKKYFSNKDEIMAHARTAVDEIKHLGREEILKIVRGDITPSRTSISMYRNNFDKNSDVYKRFIKYVYLYLKEEELI